MDGYGTVMYHEEEEESRVLIDVEMLPGLLIDATGHLGTLSDHIRKVRNMIGRSAISWGDPQGLSAPCPRWSVRDIEHTP